MGFNLPFTNPIFKEVHAYHKRPRIVKLILTRKTSASSVVVTALKLFFKAIIINSDIVTKVGDVELSLCIYRHLVYVKNIHG